MVETNACQAQTVQAPTESNPYETFYEVRKARYIRNIAEASQALTALENLPAEIKNLTRKQAQFLDIWF